MRTLLMAITVLGLVAGRIFTAVAMENPEGVTQTPPVALGSSVPAPVALPAPADPLDAKCGDGKCSPPEDCNTCPQDCGKCCGDGKCNPPEDCNTCPQDCGPCKK